MIPAPAVRVRNIKNAADLKVLPALILKGCENNVRA